MKNIKLLVSILVLVFVLNSCGKESVENPCECGQKPITAAFTITEKYYFPQGNTLDLFEPYDTDTVFASNIVFTALEEDAEYTWQIGTETLHTNIVERSGFPANQPIPITLIVKKEPDIECFPNDDGIDTLTRYLYRGDYTTSDLFIEGKFQGYLEGSPLDTFTVTIFVVPPFPVVPQSGTNGPYIKNLRGDGCEFIAGGSITSARQMIFAADYSNCDYIYGKIDLLDRATMEIKVWFTYSLSTSPDKDKPFVFYGKGL
jgi:hypothetical protein